ncbi:MAG: response regulator [Parcubacteria group bacterium]|jgi:DNA-binding response OmpR family regulator
MKILVIDDEEGLSFIISKFLKSRGFETALATNGQEGIKIIGSSEIDLVVSDINMPGKSGLDVLEYVRSNHPGIPVIMMTGEATKKERESALALGAFGIIKKPFLLSDLLGKIKEALGKE